MLPDFLIIGAARSGTTGIYHKTMQHPEIFMPLKKEPQFFSSNWDKGLNWYEALFADWNGEKVSGEASMTYTYPQFSDVPARIADVLPGARLIYVLRNPIDRTFSHYLYYHYYRGDEELTFENAIEQNRIYLGTSHYYFWIQRYLKFFGRERLLVVFFEEYVTRPQAVIKTIYRFLGVDDSFVPNNLYTETNKSFKPKSEKLFQAWKRFSRSKTRRYMERRIPASQRPLLRNFIHGMLGSQKKMAQMSNASRLRLQAYFRPEISALENFLGKDLQIWRT